MVKKKALILSTRVPVIRSLGSSYQPDLLLAVQGSSPRVACIKEGLEPYQAIRILEDVLEELRDIQWQQRQQRKKAK